MDHRRVENFYIVVAPGLEDVCASELRKLDILPRESVTGGINFSGKLRDLYLANLWLRTASRIVVRFADFQSRDFPGLYRKACRLPWGRFIKPETSIEFRVACHNSRLNHTVRIAETLESAANQSLGRSANPASSQRQLVLVRIVGDRLTISIDGSGELLHRRGYRKSATRAPLRETLAAGVLMLLDWHGQYPLVDPMCGSGSFLLEGALLAGNQAPGLKRPFAFMQWPGYRQGLWKLLCSEALRHQVLPAIKLAGADENSEAVAAARKNCQESGCTEYISISRQALEEQSPQPDAGLVISNPPYGKRLSLGDTPEVYYADLGKQLKRVFPDWRKALICPDEALIKATGIPFKRLATLDNGGLKVGLYVSEE